MEFAQNSQYVKIFAGENKLKENDLEMYKKYNKHEEKYRMFKQLINNFYNQNYQENTSQTKMVLPHTVKIQPKIIYNSYSLNCFL